MKKKSILQIGISGWKITPGSWALVRIRDNFTSIKRITYWQLIQIENINKLKTFCRIIIRSGSLANEPLAEYNKKISPTGKSIPIWQKIRLKDILLDIHSASVNNTGSESLAVNNRQINCTVYEKKEKNGSVIRNFYVKKRGINFPLKASMTAPGGKEIFAIEVFKTGNPGDAIPGGHKKFPPRSYSPDAVRLRFNEKELLNYILTARDLIITHNMSMNGIILDTSAKTITGYDRMVDSLSTADTVFIGEIHDSPHCHEMQLRVIKDFHGKNKKIVIGFEMFYRTSFIQQGLDDFVSGTMDEATFRERIYDTCWDPSWYRLYREIFLFARDKGIRMMGLNPPKQLMKKFRENPESMSGPERGWFAKEIDYVNEIHRKITEWNFMGMEAMGMKVESLYPSQCIWDDTMAESIVQCLRENPGTGIVVCAGSLHTGYRVTVPGRMVKKGDDLGLHITYKVLFPHESLWLDSSSFEEFMRLDIADYIYYVPQKEDIPGYDPGEDDSLPWMKGFKLFNEGRIEEAEKALKSDNSGMKEKIMKRTKVFKMAKSLALEGRYLKARELISDIPEIYAPAREIWMKRINAAETTGNWPD